MNNGYEIKADLVIALQTMDTSTFKAILEKSLVSFTSIIDHNSSNIFHELASTILPDSMDLDLLQIYIANFYKYHSEKTTEMIKFQINQQTLDEGLTPAMIAANCNKIVKTK